MIGDHRLAWREPALYESVVEAAVAAARLSPCQKSKRGVVIFVPDSATVIASGWNGQPGDRACDGSDGCRATCAKRCLHAEHRAIRQAIAVVSQSYSSGLAWRERGAGRAVPTLKHFDALHVKITAGQLDSSGPPSCWQCSREVLDVGLGGFWLLQDWAWRRYDADTFHHETLINCEIPA